MKKFFRKLFTFFIGFVILFAIVFLVLYSMYHSPNMIVTSVVWTIYALGALSAMFVAVILSYSIGEFVLDVVKSLFLRKK